MNYRYLITGGNGLIGKDVYNFLNLIGQDVILTTRQDLDIMSLKMTRDRIKSIRPDVVINCAGYSNVDGCEEEQNKEKMKVNYEGVKKLGRVCKRENVHLIHLSSNFVFDGKAVDPYAEEDDCKPMSKYANSKFLGEKLLFVENPFAIVLRFVWAYSFDPKCFISKLAARITRNEEVKAPTDFIGSPVSTYFIAKTIYSLVQKRIHQGGIYHLAHDDYCSSKEFLEHVLNTPVESCRLSDLNYKAIRPKNGVLNSRKLSEVIGPLSGWKDGFNYYKEIYSKVSML